MKILQICSKVPYSPKDGGGIAMKMLLEGLTAEGNTVHVISISTPKHFVNDAEIDDAFKKLTDFESVFIDTSVRPIAAFLNLFTSESYNISRFYSKAFETALVNKIKSNNYDLIQLESLWVTPYLDAVRKNTKAKVVLRSHNIEYVIWERLAETEGNPLKKRYLKLLAGRLKNYELSLLNKFDAMVMITDVDANIYKDNGCIIPMITIPFGIHLASYKIDKGKTEKNTLFHIGAMDWEPNIEGIKWFLNGVWPLVIENRPEVKLYLAGRNISDEFSKLKAQNVTVEGEVEDAFDFMNSKSIMIVPLISGGGMRVKIIEGMALGKTIISTAVGAEGIACANGTNIMIANNEFAFAQAILLCLNDQEWCNEIGSNARLLAETAYNNTHICSKLSDFYTTL